MYRQMHQQCNTHAKRGLAKITVYTGMLSFMNHSSVDVEYSSHHDDTVHFSTCTQPVDREDTYEWNRGCWVKHPAPSNTHQYGRIATYSTDPRAEEPTIIIHSDDMLTTRTHNTRIGYDRKISLEQYMYILAKQWYQSVLSYPFENSSAAWYSSSERYKDDNQHATGWPQPRCAELNDPRLYHDSYSISPDGCELP